MSDKFYPDGCTIIEALGPDAWAGEQNKPGVGANDRTDEVVEGLKAAIQNNDPKAVGDILLPYAMAFLEATADYHRLNFNHKKLGPES
jgi:hypothetical protein